MIIDLHCHIIPGIDDGPTSVEESLSMAQIALKEGITTIAATSHCTDPMNIESYLRQTDAMIQTLSAQLKHNGVNLSILKGAEVYIDMEFCKSQSLNKLTINGTSYILVELPAITIPIYTEEFLYRLQLLGFIPIIAHPERNESIMRKPEILYHLVDLGSLVQINTGSVTGFFGSSVQKCARTILKRDMAHIVATDSHSEGKRKPAIRDCIKMMTNWIGYDKTEKLIYHNPAIIIKDGIIEP